MAGPSKTGPTPLVEQNLPWVNHLREAYSSGTDLREIMVECVKIGMPPRSFAAMQKVVGRLKLSRPEGFVANTRGSVPKALERWEEILHTMYSANVHVDEILTEIQIHGAPDYVDKKFIYRMIDARGWRRGDDNRPTNGGLLARPLLPWEKLFQEMYTTGMDINHVLKEVKRMGAPADTTPDRLRKKAASRGWKRPPDFFITNRRNQALRQRLLDPTVAPPVDCNSHMALRSIYTRKTEIMRRIPIQEGELPRMYGATKFVPTLAPEVKRESPPVDLELPPPGPDGVVLAHFLVIKKYASDRNYHFDGTNVEQLNRDLRKGLPPIIMRA